MDPVDICFAAEKLTDGAKPSGTHSCFFLSLQLSIDVDNLAGNIGMVWRKLTETRKRFESLFVTSNFDEPTRRFAAKEGEGEDDACEHEMHAKDLLALVLARFLG